MYSIRVFLEKMSCATATRVIASFSFHCLSSFPSALIIVIEFASIKKL